MSSDQAFLGQGWGFPPFFAKGGADVEVVSGAEDIRQSLEILLSTRPGERALREDYGCDLSEILFEEIDQGLLNHATSLVSDAILRHEPRIKLERVDVGASEEAPGLLLIQVAYTVKSTNSRYNLVYPFYLTEAAWTA